MQSTCSATGSRESTHLNTSPHKAMAENYIVKLSAVRTTLPLLFYTLRRFGQISHKCSGEDEVVYAFVNIFRHLLTTICTPSQADPHHGDSTFPIGRPKTSIRQPNNMIFTEEVGSPDSKSCAACKRRGIACDYNLPQCTNCVKTQISCTPASSKPTSDATVHLVQNVAAQELCRLAVTFFSAVCETTANHETIQGTIREPIRDGCLFLFYKKVGQVLRAFTRNSEYSLPSHPSNNPNTRDQMSTELSREIQETEQFQEALAPILIKILQQVQPLVSESYRNTGTITQITDKIARNNDIDIFRNSTDSLMTTARKTLQRTLCNSVFGDESNTKFRPALKAPYPPDDDGNEFPTMELPDENIQTWFKHQVWRIVGWDVLIEGIKLGEN